MQAILLSYMFSPKIEEIEYWRMKVWNKTEHDWLLVAKFYYVMYMKYL